MAELRARIRALEFENARLRSLQGHACLQPSLFSPSPVDPNSQPAAAVSNASGEQQKIRLFRELFRGREDVFALRWENRTGRAGYSVACSHSHNRALCLRPSVRCSTCQNRDLTAVSDAIVRGHLMGEHTVGVYPLLTDETCWLLAADFDGPRWFNEAISFKVAGSDVGVQVAVERSRSGEGAHCWVFFEEPVPASLARNLGCALLTASMECCHQVSLTSYDRLFPSQDTLPRGGFGNLIALPLQKGPRKNGNSVFINDDGTIIPDQWSFLSTIKRVSRSTLDGVLRSAASRGRILGVKSVLVDNSLSEDDWTRVDTAPAEKDAGMPSRVGGILIRVRRENQVYIDKDLLRSPVLDRLIRIAAFQNPDFYKTQAMRMPTYGKPRVICCASELPGELCLPRGCFEEALCVLREEGYVPVVLDQRTDGQRLDVEFTGTLRPAQEEAVGAMLARDCGILCASTAFGKTVVASSLIAARKCSTLVLVHRQQLMEQWLNRLEQFLDVRPGDIGMIGAGHKRITGNLDIAMLQTIGRAKSGSMLAQYGQIIVDECHHISAFSFEEVIKQSPAKYVVGLTATPIRRDGHHPIIIMQCGPISFRSSTKHGDSGLRTVVKPRSTSFRLSWDTPDAGIQEVYAQLATDARRNDQIVADVLRSLAEGRSPLVLTERTTHLEYLASLLSPVVQHTVVLRGGMGVRSRKEAMKTLASVPKGEQRLLIATGRYIGEGFDDARLDTLFLTMPISWRGILQQYAGRLQRTAEDKDMVEIYDYVDLEVPVLAKMYAKRKAGYRSMGFEIKTE